MGTILLLPNVGAEPRGYARTFGARVGDGAAADAAAALPAFWAQATDVSVATAADGRVVVDYSAPTVSRGVRRQRIVAERVGCDAEVVGADSLVFAERWAQASSVQDVDAGDDDVPSPPLSGCYTAWRRWDALATGDVRETARVAAFDDDPAALSAEALAVYDYSFLLRRPLGGAG